MTPSEKLPLSLPRLYPILDTRALEQHGLDVVRAAKVLLDAGAAIVQYRHKGSFTEARFLEAEQIAQCCRETSRLFILNDRADFAKLLNAGLHLGQTDLPPEQARDILGSHLPIGWSTHNERQLREPAPVDYVALGPIFSTSSKVNPDPEIGLAELSRLRRIAPVPLVAIGGITPETAVEVLDNGADSVAVISGLLPQQHGSLAAFEKRVMEWIKRVG
jgi:thiamine-phosphate pyrophosphorylase